MNENLDTIEEKVTAVARGLLDLAGLETGDILVVGCSTSEVMGEIIGSSSSMEVAKAIMSGLFKALNGEEIFLAIQACEHLNRALVVDKECAKKHSLEIVNVLPHPGAGGSLAAYAMEAFQNPVVVEKIKAQAGIDIGDTLIGMHLQPVAVPVRADIKKIGKAHLTMARTRPKLIGGERAKYRKEKSKKKVITCQ